LMLMIIFEKLPRNCLIKLVLYNNGAGVLNEILYRYLLQI